MVRLAYLLFFISFFASAATHQVGDWVAHGSVTPATTGQDLGDSTHKWDLWVASLNTGLGQGFAVIDGSGNIARVAYGATTTYMRGDGTTQTLDTSVVPANGNLYFTNALARAAISATAPINYNSTTGVITCVSASTSVDGCLSSTDWNTFNGKQAADSDLDAVAALTGTGYAARTGTNTWALRTFSATAPIQVSNGTGASGNSVITCDVASGSQPGCLASADFTAFNAKESALTFSTGLTRSTNTITVNTSQNIATLSNLTTNGYVKTSGGVGTLGVSTPTAAFAELYQTISTTSGDLIYGGASGTPTRLAAGTNGDVLTLAGGVPTWAAAGGGASAINCAIERNTPNGVGSTGNRVRTYSTQVTTGSCGLSSTSDATNGDTFTIGTAGYYCVYVEDSRSGGTARFGASVNNSSTTTALSGLTTATVVVECSATSGERNSCSSCGYFAASSTIRPHGDGSALDCTSDHCKTRISRSL